MNETITRSLSGLVYVLLLILATLFSRETFLLLFGLFLLQTVNEFCALVKLPKIQSLIMAGVLYFIFSFFFSDNKFTDFGLIIASLFVSFKLILWLFKDKLLPTIKEENWVNLIGYIILPFIFITKIPLINDNFIPSIIIGIFILIWTNDTFAYIVGKSIGKNKLFEKISPKKTIEGFVGGIIFAVIASVIIAKYYTKMHTYIWITTAVIVGIFGTIGDLVESKFKRVANLKDSGNIMPGHGGILDRLDSIIFVSPFLFLFYKIISYVS
ncbi:phosphatidate cytidylyltransferase [Flavobacterium sp.]|uniref:phosphatidate cytidylyltransferase n=1 Tax=Flavobacterium sp. TaxID=239 RepID=UPI003752EB52